MKNICSVSLWCCSLLHENLNDHNFKSHSKFNRQKQPYFKHHGKSGAKCELIAARRGNVKKFSNPAEQVSCCGLTPCFQKEGKHRKWVGRNYPFKLLPLLDFRETIMASDKLFGTQPNKIKNSFPSSCLPINFPPFHSSSSGDLCWFVQLGTAEGSTSD